MSIVASDRNSPAAAALVAVLLLALPGSPARAEETASPPQEGSGGQPISAMSGWYEPSDVALGEEPGLFGSSGLALLADTSAPPADDPYYHRARRRHDAREGFLFSLGIGAAQNYLSGVGHAGGVILDMRMGYGFSDRFQLFFDLSALPADYGYGLQATSWTGTVRGQTVLIGDRRGNGLNLNFGVGLGGLDDTSNSGFVNQRVGLALAGGLSLDLRVRPDFAISPEFIAQWHQVPNDPPFADDIHRAFGFQVNFTWYSY